MKIGIVAGEVSGDILGQDLMSAIKSQYPTAQFYGVGGDLMLSEGLKLEFPMERLSVMGLVPILKRLPELLKRRKKLIQALVDFNIDVFIGIDAPEFNLGLEKKLKSLGIRTVHYVSPSVWAWREKRIFKIKQSVDLMLTLLPFEQDIYKKHQIPVTFVGHPLAKQIPSLTREQDLDKKQQARKELQLGRDEKVIAVMPGSRGTELKFIGPEFAATIAKLEKKHPSWKFVIPCANSKRMEQWLAISKQYEMNHAVAVDGQSRACMRAADAILLASGTATLEGLLFNRPMVVAYKVSKLSMAIIRKLLTIDYYSLPNLLLGKKSIPELIQENCTAEKLVVEVEKAVEDSHHLSASFSDIHQSLALDSGQIAARAIFDLLDSKTFGNTDLDQCNSEENSSEKSA